MFDPNPPPLPPLRGKNIDHHIDHANAKRAIPSKKGSSIKPIDNFSKAPTQLYWGFVMYGGSTAITVPVIVLQPKID